MHISEIAGKEASSRLRGKALFSCSLFLVGRTLISWKLAISVSIFPSISQIAVRIKQVRVRAAQGSS
jgi:hypothetical protein